MRPENRPQRSKMPVAGCRAGKMNESKLNNNRNGINNERYNTNAVANDPNTIPKTSRIGNNFQIDLDPL